MNDCEESARFSSNAVLPGVDELGIASVSQSLFDKVTHYHAQIGHNVKRDTLQTLEFNLLSEAKTLFHARKYEEALNTFTHCLAITEKTRSAKDQAVRGAIVHNIASCLHNLGEMEAAQAYYEQAIQAFEKAPTPLVERVIYGDPNKRRVEFVKERLIDITWGRKPDLDKFLDENGVKRPVPELPPGMTPSSGDTSLSKRWATEAPPPPPWALEEEVGAMRDYPFDRKPAWLAAAGCNVSDETPSKTDVDQREAATSSAGDDEARQERARQEWLQYYLQTGDWDKAAELVVSEDEREDLRYLVERERRLGSNSKVTDDVQGASHEAAVEQLNDAAMAAQSHKGGYASVPDDQML